MERLGARVVPRPDDRHLGRAVQRRLGHGEAPAGEPGEPSGEPGDHAERALRRLPMPPRAGERGVGEQRARGREPARGGGLVDRAPGTLEEPIPVVRGVVEPARPVGEPGEHGLQQVAGPAEPPGLAGHAVEGEEPLGHVRVVLEHAGRGARPAVPRGAQQPDRVPAGHVDLVEQRGRALRGLDQVGPAEQGTGLGQGRDGEPVPRGDHLVVPLRARAPLPRPPQLGADPLEPLVVVRIGGEPEHGGAVLEGAALGHPEHPGRPAAVLLAEDLPEPGRGPDVEQALTVPTVRAGAVGVEGGGEASLGGAHLPEQPSGGLQRHPAGEGRPGRPPPVGVHPQQQGVVVQHLLEVRHDPRLVHAVAGEPAAELVVDAAARHRLQRPLRHGEGLGRAAPEQELQHHGRRELGRAAEPAVPLVEAPGEGAHRLVQGLLVRQRPGRRLGPLAERLRQPRPLLQQGRPVLAPQPRDGAQQPLELVPGEVGPGVERVALGRGEDGERPAALAGHRLEGLHVDRVDVRPFLAVDLDVDEVLVHEPGGGLVLEGLTGHHMAPRKRITSGRTSTRWR